MFRAGELTNLTFSCFSGPVVVTVIKTNMEIEVFCVHCYDHGMTIITKRLFRSFLDWLFFSFTIESHYWTPSVTGYIFCNKKKKKRGSKTFSGEVLLVLKNKFLCHQTGRVQCVGIWQENWSSCFKFVEGPLETTKVINKIILCGHSENFHFTKYLPKNVQVPSWRHFFFGTHWSDHKNNIATASIWKYGHTNSPQSYCHFKPKTFLGGA